MSNITKVARVLIAIALIATGCSQGKRPFLMVQLCLAGDSDLRLLESELRAIADEDHSQFVDSSGSTKRSLESIGHSNAERTLGSPVVSWDINRKDGSGVGIGNLSLPGYQIALGFSAKADPSESKRFADTVVQRLKTHWQVYVVPDDRGALPLSNCQYRE